MTGIGVEGSDEQHYDIKVTDKSISVGWIRERADKNEFQLTGHTHKERQEETIIAKEIRDALMKAETLENYSDDPRGLSFLVSGLSGGRAIHVVCGRTKCDWLPVITVYISGPPKSMDERTRTKRGDKGAA